MKCEQIKKEIVKFIHDKVTEAGFSNVVIGLSGGLDSSVVVNLAVEALGKEKIFGILMPKREEEVDLIGGGHFQDAYDLAESLDINNIIIPLTVVINHKYFLNKTRIRYGNIAARARMLILYDQAAKMNAIVLGTTNKSEFMLGYFTKYGDGGVDIEPIVDLYKTEVIKLARYIDIPNTIINKQPTADLWPNQTDEEELGVKYSDVDKILWWLIEEEYDPIKFIEDMYKLTGIEDKSILDRVMGLISSSRHKRHTPKMLRIGNISIRKSMGDGVKYDKNQKRFS